MGGMGLLQMLRPRSGARQIIVESASSFDRKLPSRIVLTFLQRTIIFEKKYGW